MSLTQGRYFLQPASLNDRYVGTGPVPHIYPLPPLPLRSMSYQWKIACELIRDGGDQFIIKVPELNVTVAYDKDNNVRLGPYGEKPVQWAVDQGVGAGLYTIKLPNEDKCWTAGGHDEFTPIRLEGADGNPAQQWKFIPVPQD